MKFSQNYFSSLLIFVCLLYSCLNTHSVSSLCLPDQKSLLLELRSSLKFSYPTSTKLRWWNNTTDCCQWNGVECDSSIGRVIGLDLSYEAINGSIDNSNSLFQLHHLRRLNLAGNFEIVGRIPSAFSNLSGLTHLNLSETGFRGQVPVEIAQLEKLIILDLSFFFLVDSESLRLENPNLASIIGNLTNIRELYLDGVVISAEGDEWCKALSSSLPHLKVLSMSYCDLRGQLHHSLLKLQHLSVIRLDGNYMSGVLPDFLSRFKNLTTLQLVDCDLTGTVPRSLFQLTTLETLDLSYNSMLQGTLPDFPTNSSFQNLVLSFTNFSGLLPSTISNLKRLKKIELQNCNFWGSISTKLRSLYQLEYVDLSDNRFSGPMPLFSSGKSLKHLNLRRNCLNGTISSMNWEELLNLVYADLSENVLEGGIPTSLFLLPSLKGLLLAKNYFSGQLNEFPSAPYSLLGTLDLSNNNLEGSIPESIFQLRALKVLNVSFNRFNSTLELTKILQHLNNLSYLDLSYNHLLVIGETNDCSVGISFPQLSTLRLASCNLKVLPEFLRNQSKLEALDVSDNQIQGKVPRWIWKLSQLNLSCNSFMDLEKPLPHVCYIRSLDLHSNQLQGQLPDMEFPYGFYLDFSNNNLTSMNPNLGNSIPFARFISLSMNSISGVIPTSFCNATQLRVLDLEQNYLSGTIPDCLVAMNQSLGVLNVKGNRISGAISNEFGRGCKLETLILNGNYLQGQIPRSLVNCKALKILDLGNNKLHGTFPCHLRSLSKLQVLILRSNKFYGAVACPGCNSIWPSLQIFDLASNHFSGELTAQFLLEWTPMRTQSGEAQSRISHLQFSVFQLGQIYYQDEVAVTFKGLELTLQKILTIFTSIDLSNNKFHGEIPRELGNLNALVVLNLSHNSLYGNIPSSIRNLSQIQSLDFSCNGFSGIIPPQLANLNFLEYLNLSYNKLSGKIPTSTQLQSFDASSFEGNQGLYGPPLTPMNRSKSDLKILPSISPQDSHWSSKNQIEWMLRGAEVGFPVGITVFIGPLLYIKRWKQWYCVHLDKVVMRILSKRDGRKGRSRQQRQTD